MQPVVDASLIPASALVPVARWAQRIIANILMVISFLGSYVMLNNWRWEWPDTNQAMSALGLALLYQVVFSLLQFAFRASWQSIWYAMALGGSVVPSVLSYGLLLHERWTDQIATFLPESVAGLVAWLCLTVVLTVVDLIPEQILVRRSAPIRR